MSQPKNFLYKNDKDQIIFQPCKDNWDIDPEPISIKSQDNLILIIKVRLKEFLNLEQTHEFIQNYYKEFVKNGNYFPTIILTDYLIFDEILAHLESKLKSHNNENRQEISRQVNYISSTRSDLLRNINFLNNSSIWFRLCGLNNLDLSKTIKELDNFIRLGFYKNPNAMEYLEYHLRIQGVNYLISKSGGDISSGHGSYITPNLYSNEQYKRENISIKDDVRELIKTPNVILRILLIDDKVGKKSECKAEFIKKLLTLDFDPEKKSDVCWKTSKELDDSPVVIFQDCCDRTATCSGCYSLKDGKNIAVNNSLEIYAVKNLGDARLLLGMENLRFDLIMMDFLLDRKVDSFGNYKGEREYATEFWGDGREKYFEISKKTIASISNDNNYSKDEKENYRSIYQAYSKIKSNRGPLQRLWIFPITAFNQTFIDDLRNKGVRLIDYYWYLSRGADPINTPYLFINALNKFLLLQIESAIYSKEELTTFLDKSIEKFDKILKNKITGEATKKEAIRNLFGSEYVFFIANYGMQEQINRDADQGSLFALFIKKNFFSMQDSLCNFNNSIRKLYHTLACGEDSEKIKCIERLFRMNDQLSNLETIPQESEERKRIQESFLKIIGERFKREQL